MPNQNPEVFPFVQQRFSCVPSTDKCKGKLSGSFQFIQRNTLAIVLLHHHFPSVLLHKKTVQSEENEERPEKRSNVSFFCQLLFFQTVPLALSLDYHLPTESFKAKLEKNLVVTGSLGPNSIERFMWKPCCFILLLTGGLVFEIKIFLVCLLSI